MVQCPKCGYERQPHDESLVSREECPKCGVIYSKYEKCQARNEGEKNTEVTPPECLHRGEDPSILDIPLPSGDEQAHFQGVRNFISRFKLHPAITRFFSALKDSRPILLLNKYCDTIAALLLAVWAGGVGYWLYLFVMMDINPQPGWRLLAIEPPNNPKEAMVLLFFGAIAGIFAFVAFCFAIKFAYNMVWGSIEGIFPKRFYLLIRSVALLLLLCILFSCIKGIKKAGYSAYYQTEEIVLIARQNSVIIHVDSPVHRGILNE